MVHNVGQNPVSNLQLFHFPLLYIFSHHYCLQYFIEHMLFHSRSYGNVYHSRSYEGTHNEWLGHDQSLYDVFYDMHNATMNLFPSVVLTVEHVPHVINFVYLSNYSA